MTSPAIVPLVVDLSHWDPAEDYHAVKRDGIVGCIYKATEGSTYTDPTYVSQQHAAKAAGLKWGAYHFATAASVQQQIDNFLRFASPDPDELFCLDWEDYGSNTMSLENVKIWIQAVEDALHRPNQCVLYSGNTAKEALGDREDAFLAERRLWLCQYGSTPSWQRSWDHYWLWQFTDGQVGPSPHTIDGIGPCDINSYDLGPASQLIAEWATGTAEPVEPPGGIVPPDLPAITQAVTILINAPPGIPVKTRVFSLSPDSAEAESVRRALKEKEGLERSRIIGQQKRD